MIPTEQNPARGVDGAEVSEMRLPSHTRYWITVCASGMEQAQRNLLEAANACGAVIVSQMVFAGASHYELFGHGLEKAEWPLTCVLHHVPGDNGFCSMQAVAVSGVKPESFEIDGRGVGRWFEDNDARYCWLGGIRPPETGGSREEQAEAVFHLMEESLDCCGMRCTDIVRTWLYIDRILDWYDGFNRVRNDFLTERGMFEKLLPASTGIGAANPYGTALLASAEALVPVSGRVTVRAVDSPLQPPAPSYSSAFSRAVETGVASSHRCLYVSGTAAIDEQGESMHAGSTARQVECTMGVVAGLLESRAMSWSNVARGVIYIKRPQDRAAFDGYCRDNRLPDFPLAVLHSDICRRELLFEIELDAVDTNPDA